MTSPITPNPSVTSVVAIAASAGGLEATSLLAQNLPADQSCCYAIAQHMSPSHKSMLVQLLSRETKLTVEELDQETVPQPNKIYIPPPGHDVIFEDGAFVLRPPSGHPASPKPSADRLFSSLANAFGEQTIGVVLSGTGSDGSYGIKYIREKGGITIAQEPSTCKYDSMPAAAIRTGCIDLTLTPQQIGEHIGQILQRPRDLSELKELNEKSNKNRDLFEILLAQTLVDFRQYKETTINRRIQRRMIAKGIDSFENYVDLCRKSVEEVDALYKDLLISVTRFFRDPDQFEALKDTVFTRFNKADRTAPVRVWIPGCATGEEAYTIAILIAEALGGIEEISQDGLQIFATDIDDHALSVARKGVYPQAAVNDIPSEYLGRYFDIKEDSIIVNPKLRSHVMFSHHNVFQDPPFLNVDLVSIRNVLIYFNAKLQERVLTRIMYALNTTGLLFLGTSETLGHMDGYFSQSQLSARLFAVRDHKLAIRATEAAFRGLNASLSQRPESAISKVAPSDDWTQFDRLAAAVVTDGILVNRERNVLRVYGDIAPFSSLTSQSFGHSNVTILKKPLASDAASLAMVALKQEEKRSGQWHKLAGLDGKVAQITAYPMLAAGNVAEDLVLLGISTIEQPKTETNETEKTEYVTYLEDELSRTRDALQVTIEQLQTSNEELQAVNEELQSSNEELQSTNEELETSNEELQSTNEELITVNEELLVNTSQMERISAELNGLVNNAPAALLMVDQGLIIRYASKRAIQMFGLAERGIGYGHLSQVEIPSGFPAMVDLCSSTLVSRKSMQHSFRTGLKINELNIAPVVASEEKLVGLVVQIQSIESEDSTSLLNETIRDIADVHTWRLNMTTGEVDLDRRRSELQDPKLKIDPKTFDDFLSLIAAQDRDRVEQKLRSAAQGVHPFHVSARVKSPDGHIYVAEMIGEAFVETESQDVYLLAVSSNVSETRNREMALAHYDLIAQEHGIGFYSYDVKNDLPYWNPSLFKLLGYEPTPTPTVEMGLSIFPEEARKRVEGFLAEAIEHGKGYEYIEEITRVDGRRARVRGKGNVALNKAGVVTHIYGSFEILEELPPS